MLEQIVKRLHPHGHDNNSLVASEYSPEREKYTHVKHVRQTCETAETGYNDEAVKGAKTREQHNRDTSHRLRQ